MPSASLSDQEQARVDAGMCACGCGRKLPPDSRWNGTFYARPACKQKAYRERRKAGRVIPQDTRTAETARKQAEALEAEAKELDQQAAYYGRLAAEKRALAARFKEKAEGQVFIPGTAPALRRAIG